MRHRPLLTSLAFGSITPLLRRLNEEGLQLGLAVNVSTHDLFDSRLPDRVRKYLEGNGVAPSLLTLEITESSLLVDAPAVVDLTAGEPAAEAATDDATEEPDEPTAPKAALRATLTDLAAAPGRTLHALLWADADVPALVHAGREDLITDAAAARDDALDREFAAAKRGGIVRQAEALERVGR